MHYLRMTNVRLYFPIGLINMVGHIQDIHLYMLMPWELNSGNSSNLKKALSII